jgi:dihydrofolate synthase
MANSSTVKMASPGIRLGLARVQMLAPAQTWRAIHVAGTNGKGSICNYITALLRKNHRFKVGQFTSPHLIWPRDSIQVNGEMMSEDDYNRVQAGVVKFAESSTPTDSPSNFEILTLTAFKHFEEQNVDYGVIEVGLGGALDATNVLQKKQVTVISKIGLDHLEFLGSTVAEITKHKAGIMVKDVPCVVDGSNDQAALSVLRQHAQETGARFLSTSEEGELIQKLSRDNSLMPHQIQNMACAILAYQKAVPDPGHIDKLISVLKDVKIPGRLYKFDVNYLLPPNVSRGPILVDGAHNVQSAEVLGRFVERKLRAEGKSITWIVSMSKGRNPSQILEPLVREGDTLISFPFSEVPDMPWVEPTSPAVILDAVPALKERRKHVRTVEEAIREAVHQNPRGPIVVAGSLYGVRDLMASKQSHRKDMRDESGLGWMDYSWVDAFDDINEFWNDDWVD